MTEDDMEAFEIRFTVQTRTQRPCPHDKNEIDRQTVSLPYSNDDRDGIGEIDDDMGTKNEKKCECRVPHHAGVELTSDTIFF